ncbi:MAG: permease [Micavibrio sp.]|nr:permease [Micavibrio sp.]|tara:strand:- start:1671 stop:2615 length:945 start_codon:yes stop_codon:yes gene_type:complete
MAFFLPGDKKLGVATGRRRYDLPLNKSAGTGFLVLLIALMTFLGVMALAGSFALGSMAHHWSSGLENKLTIEIPADDATGTIRTREDIEKLSESVTERLSAQNFIRDIHALSQTEIQELIAPWLGEDAENIPDMPLPGLIAVEFITINDHLIEKMRADLANIAPNIVIDRHESWLADILRLTGALQFATLLTTLMIGATTIIAIAGAVKSRIAIHRKDVELLHLMGASDRYISRQFQRHALILALQGAAAGAAAGLLGLLAISLFAGDTAAALLPEFQLNMIHIFTLAALPAAACFIAAATAKFTVLRELALMP